MNKNKKALVVTAHPYENSMNFSLKNQAIKTFQKLGCEILESQPFQDGFSSFTGLRDFTHNHNLNGRGLLTQQKLAHKHQAFVDEIIQEQDKIQNADVIFIQFPVWWGSMPAALRGWIERVFTNGLTYGSQFILQDKPVILSVTTSTSLVSEQKYGESTCDMIQQLAEDIFGYMKMKVLPTYVTHDVKDIDEKKNRLHMANMDKYINNQFRGFES